MLQDFANLLITLLIWSITLGLYHIIFNWMFLFFLFKVWDHIKWAKALLLSVFFSGGGFILFFFPLWFVIVWLLQIPFVLPEDTYQGSFDYGTTSFLYTIAFATVQTILLFLIRTWIHMKMWRIFPAIVTANLMSGILVYKLIR